MQGVLQAVSKDCRLPQRESFGLCLVHVDGGVSSSNKTCSDRDGFGVSRLILQHVCTGKRRDMTESLPTLRHNARSECDNRLSRDRTTLPVRHADCTFGIWRERRQALARALFTPITLSRQPEIALCEGHTSLGVSTSVIQTQTLTS